MVAADLQLPNLPFRRGDRVFFFIVDIYASGISIPLSLLMFLSYLMSKFCPNSFAAAYNNKAYTLFSSRRLR